METLMDRPLRDFPLAEIELELALRRGPDYRCKYKKCGALYTGSNRHYCTACARFNALEFIVGMTDDGSEQYRQWAAATSERMRAKQIKVNESEE